MLHRRNLVNVHIPVRAIVGEVVRVLLLPASVRLHLLARHHRLVSAVHRVSDVHQYLAERVE